jgi:hypothetical protein
VLVGAKKRAAKEMTSEANATANKPAKRGKRAATVATTTAATKSKAQKQSVPAKKGTTTRATMAELRLLVRPLQLLRLSLWLPSRRGHQQLKRLVSSHDTTSSIVAQDASVHML